MGKGIGQQVEKSLARQGYTITPPLGVSRIRSKQFQWGFNLLFAL